MKMIAFASEKDHRILIEGDDKGDRMITIVEEFANKGLEVLEREVLDAEDRGEERLDALIELLLGAYHDEEDANGTSIIDTIIL